MAIVSEKPTIKTRKNNVHYTVISVFHESEHEELSKKMERVILRAVSSEKSNRK